MKTSPCKECSKRTLGCHATCEDYLQFRVERDKINMEKVEKEASENWFAKRWTRFTKKK